jgi:predicted ATPase
MGAVRSGLVVRADNAYRFLHDRIQGAAYALVPEPQRPAAHLRIARLLTAATPAGKLEESVFDIVNQFSRGAALIAGQKEREQVAELNFAAGKRARADGAIGSRRRVAAPSASVG